MSTFHENSIRDIQMSHVTADIVKEDDGYTQINVSLPQGISLTGEYDPSYPDSEGRLFMSAFGVPPGFRHRGFGTRLVKALTHVAVAQGFKEMHGSTSSPSEVKIFKSIFDETDVAFIDGKPNSQSDRELPIMFNEVVASLEREQEMTLNVTGFDFILLLTDVDLSKLEAPQEIQK